MSFDKAVLVKDKQIINKQSFINCATGTSETGRILRSVTSICLSESDHVRYLTSAAGEERHIITPTNPMGLFLGTETAVLVLGGRRAITGWHCSV